MGTTLYFEILSAHGSPFIMEGYIYERLSEHIFLQILWMVFYENASKICLSGLSLKCVQGFKLGSYIGWLMYVRCTKFYRYSIARQENICVSICN